jgi:hypothetical protein
LRHGICSSILTMVGLLGAKIFYDCSVNLEPT